MRKMMIALMAASTAFAVAPAAAQDWRGGGYEDDRGGYGYGRGYSQQIERLRFQIDRLAQQGRLDRREVGYLRGQVGQLYQLERRYGRGGFNQWERRDLQQRIAQVHQRLRYAAGNRWDRRDDRWDRDDRYDGRDRDRWDRRDRDDDRWDDDDD